MVWVEQIQDDILIHGKGAQHDERLIQVLKRLRERGITLREEKCCWGQPSVKWFGMQFSCQGMSIDPEKTEAIRNLPPPTDPKGLKSFLHMVQFNLKFLHPAELDKQTTAINYQQLVAPLRALDKKGVVWNWTEECQAAYQAVKDLMDSGKVLAHYDPVCSTRVYVDYSPHGVSATLAQAYQIDKQQAIKMRQADNIRAGMVEGKDVDWRPVTHVSRTITDAEKNYAQIEGESLATFYGVWRLRRYLYGSKFQVVNDHKPLQPHYNRRKLGPMRVESH